MRMGIFAAVVLVLFSFPPLTEAGNGFWEMKYCPQRVKPGRALRLTAVYRGMGPAEIRAEGWDQEVVLRALREFPGTYEGFLAVPLGTKAGTYSLTVAATPVKGSQRDCRALRVEVLHGPVHRITRLTIPHFEQYHYNNEAPVLAASRQEADFSGPRIKDLIFPVPNGKSSRNFGDQRIYNQGAASWYHRGIDIRAKEGSQVLAAGDGKVMLVRHFQADGNTILIDHGFGVTSCYLHQRTMWVKVGDYVRQGQVIGEVGHTGAALGSHLHFQINVNGVPVEPSEFFPARRHSLAKKTANRPHPPA